MQLKRTDWGIIGFGGLIFLVSSYFFILDTDQIFRWMGLDRFEKRPKIAEVEVIRNMVRRKEFEMPEFRSVQIRQDVRVKDSVMTGSQSVAVLHFVDGTVIELGPDSLVQLDTRGSPDALGNFQLLVDVQKGEVRSAGPVKKLKVVRNRKEIEVMPVAKDSVAARVAEAITEKKPITREVDCEEASVERKEGELQIRMLCPGVIAEKQVRILDSAGALVAMKTVAIAPHLPSKIGWVPVKPGVFTLEFDQGKKVKASLVVPERVKKLKWAESPLRCGRALAYIPSNTAVSAQVEDEQGKTLSNFTPGNGLIQSVSSIPVPAKLKVVEVQKDGFKWETPLLEVARWRSCPVLTNPADGSNERLNPLLGTMFTWTSLGGEDHFQFELAEDAGFNRILLTQESRMNLIRIKPPKSGEAFWRVKDMKSMEYSNVSRVVFR
jgi:hypothetical protein